MDVQIFFFQDFRPTGFFLLLRIPGGVGGLPGGGGVGPWGWEGVCREFGAGVGGKIFFGAEMPAKKFEKLRATFWDSKIAILRAWNRAQEEGT